MIQTMTPRDSFLLRQLAHWPDDVPLEPYYQRALESLSEVAKPIGNLIVNKIVDTTPEVKAAARAFRREAGKQS